MTVIPCQTDALQTVMGAGLVHPCTASPDGAPTHGLTPHGIKKTPLEDSYGSSPDLTVAKDFSSKRSLAASVDDLCSPSAICTSNEYQTPTTCRRQQRSLDDNLYHRSVASSAASMGYQTAGYYQDTRQASKNYPQCSNSTSDIYQPSTAYSLVPRQHCTSREQYQCTSTSDMYEPTSNFSDCRTPESANRYQSLGSCALYPSTSTVPEGALPINASEPHHRPQYYNRDHNNHTNHNVGQDGYRTPDQPSTGPLYQTHEGKVVIRPIAYRPAAPSPAQLAHGLTSPSGPIAGVGGRPPQDPRYTSTPALTRGGAPHYGSLGDLKSMGHSLDRRGFGTPLTHGPPPPPNTSPPHHPTTGPHPTKHASMTHLHHTEHSSDFTSHIHHRNHHHLLHHNGHHHNSGAGGDNNTSLYTNTNGHHNSLNQSVDSGNNFNSTHLTNNNSSNSNNKTNSSNNYDSNSGSPSRTRDQSSSNGTSFGGDSGFKSSSEGENSSHNSSLSPQPCPPPPPHHHHHHNHTTNSSSNNGNSHSYSNHTNASNINNSHHHSANLNSNYPTNSGQSQTRDQQYNYSVNGSNTNASNNINSGHRTSDINNLPRGDSLKNLSISSTGDGSINNNPSSTSSALHQHHFHHLQQQHHHHLHHRMGGSVSNLNRLGAGGNGHITSNNTAAVAGMGSTASGGGSTLALDRSSSVTGSSNQGLGRGGGSVSGSMTELDDPSHQTPSPSDSGVAELEAILKEKDCEINLLKESMEQSEQIICKVYEEKERNWERELKKIRDTYEARLKEVQQKATTVEQSLSSQAYQLQQERRKVATEASETRRERDAGRGQQHQLQQQVHQLRQQLEETEWGLCQKSGEISLLKSQLKDCQGDQTSRGHELLALRAQLRQYAQEVERRRAETSSLHELTAALRREAAELRAQRGAGRTGEGDELADQLRQARQELQMVREDRVRSREREVSERARWQQEKEKVLRYQRQLQLACAHAQRTNRRLHTEIARLQGAGDQQPPSLTPPPVVPPLPSGYAHPPSPPPPPPGVLSEEALC